MTKISLKRSLALFSCIFLFWSFYRYFPEFLPTWFEELVFKPAFWLLPTFWLVLNLEKQPLSSLGFTSKNKSKVFYWSFGFGIIFFVEGFLTNILKYRGLQISFPSLSSAVNVFFLSLMTAFTEETLFRGYFFTRFSRLWHHELWANLASSFLFALIHLPMGVFVLSYVPAMLLIYFFLVFIFAFASAFIFARTQNLFSSILLHLFWSWPIMLFK
ncbi:MAG: CPBP family intramembrane glutamic endopeptidase [Candidatus Shapirobacteria bacterium]